MGDQSGPIIENGGQNGDAGCSDTGPSSIVGVGPPSPLTGCYLLIVIGEPHSPEHKDIILQRLVKGFLSWDMSNCHVDLEEELNTITLHAPEGEEARHGERLIQYASENLVTEILIHPQFNTLIQCMRNLLSSFTRHRHIIHVGYTFAGNGSWILQDGTFSVADFAEAFQEHEVQRVLRAYPDTITMDIHCASAGLWTSLDDKNFAKSCKIRINPNDVLNSGSEKINTFIDYLTPMLVPASLTDLLESSDVVGNIRFSHPTLYVFPGGQGDAALFGINGFNMLVDGGFSRKACFWDFARHLDRLDAVLMTRVNNSNLNGLSSVVERKQNSNVYPQIGHFFCNIPDRKNLLSPDGDKDRDPLIIDLIEKGHHLVNNLKSLNLKPQICYRDTEPINLYHKVGHGTLDMYVLSPAKDSKEVKDFLAKWNAGDQKLFAPKDGKDFAFPIQNMVSVCALLVWQPANPEDPITRILFPGSTPDYKIIEGLEKIKRLDFMKYPVCSAKSIAPSISVSSITKKTIKSATSDKITPEPILPSKVTKSIQPEKDNKITDNKMKNAQIDNKGKTEENEQNVIEEMKIEKQAIKSIAASRGDIKSRIVKDKQKIEPKKTDNRILDAEKKSSSDEYNGDKKAELDNVDNFDNKIEQEKLNGEKIENEIEKTTKKEEAEIKAKSKMETKTKVEAKSKIDTKSSVKSRIDSKPPRSIERKQIKKDISEKKDATKSSPSGTPKRTADKLTNGVAKDKEIKPKISTRTTISSPSGTPAKSAKEANNRKVVESKQKNILATKREVSKTTEKKEVKEIKEVKTEKKTITRRPKTAGISSKAPGSPLKTKKMAPLKTEKDYIIRKAKLEKGGTTDSSLVSTPSAEDSAIKKIVELDSSQDIDVVKQRELNELKEEQEAVREIEAVFIRDQEKATTKTTLTEHRKVTEIIKQDSTTEAEDEEEYLIIEKEEQYTEDSINEQESSVTKEEEIQKHQRDSEESEKKRKGSLQVTEEEEEMVELTKEQDIAKQQDTQLDEVVVLEIIEGETKDKETKDEDEQEDMQPDSIEEKGIKMSADDKEDLENEVQDIITSAKEIAKAKTESRDDSNLKTEEMSTPSPEDKISSAKKTTDTKDDIIDAAPEQEAREPLDGIMQESQPDEKFSATIESGATTAPTLPEDERIPLDEIKEDLVIEEKYVKEDTKESDIPIKTVIMQTHEPVERIIPAKMHFDVQQSHLRDIVKTPDEVADLPVHEEADFGAYDEYQETKKPETKKIITKEPLPKELKTSPEGVSALVTDDKVDKAEKMEETLPEKVKDLPSEQIPTQNIDDEAKPKTVISDKHSEQVTDDKTKPVIVDEIFKAADPMIHAAVIESDIVIKDIKKTEASLKDAEIKSDIAKIDTELDKVDQDNDQVEEEVIEPMHMKTIDRQYTPKDKDIVLPKKSENDIIKDIESQLISDMIITPDKSKKVPKMETPKDEKPSLSMEELAAKVEEADKAVVKIIEKTPTDEPEPKDEDTEIKDTEEKLDDSADPVDDTPKMDDIKTGILGKIDTTIKNATEKVDDKILDVKGKLEETTENLLKKAEETDRKIAAAIVDETKKIDEKISHLKDGIDKTVENLETEKNKIAAGIDDSVQQVKSGIAAGIDEVGKTAEKVKSDVEHKLEKTKDDIKAGADTIVNDILGTVESKATELTDAGDKLITKLDDKVHDVKEKVEKQAEEIQEKTKTGISSFFGGLSQGIISGIDKYANKLDEKIKIGAESVESALQDVDTKIKQGTSTVDSAIQGLADKTGKIVDDVNKDLQKVDDKLDDVTSSDKHDDEKTDDDKEKQTLDDISNYLDKICKGVPKDSDLKKPTFGAKVPPMFTSELRETHITTLDSPVNEVCRIDEIKTLEKLPEVAEETVEATSKSPIIVVADDKLSSFDREETNLNDIKEEDEEDERYSPTRKEAKDINIINEKLEPSRSVSPRERTPEEVTKIVATVAEVLKSDKDITEIIPDFDEEELNKKLRLDSLTDDLDLLDGQDASTVQRMLVTASSEDGGEETEICPEGTIKFTCSPSPSALEMAEKSLHDMDDYEYEQNRDESTQDNAQDENEIDYDAPKHDLEKSAQSSIDKSYNDKESSPVSIEEKEVHELPEKLHSKESHEDIINSAADKTDLKLDDIHGKESATAAKLDEIDSRRESAYSAYSEKDYTKDESSLGIDDKDHSRSHSIVSHTSEKSIEDIQYDSEVCEKKKTIELEKSEKDAKTVVPQQIDDVKLTGEPKIIEKSKSPSPEPEKPVHAGKQSPEPSTIGKSSPDQKMDDINKSQEEQKEKLEPIIADKMEVDIKSTIEPAKSDITKSPTPEPTIAGITSPTQKQEDIKSLVESEKSEISKSPSPDHLLHDKASQEQLKTEVSKTPSPELAVAGKISPTQNLKEKESSEVALSDKAIEIKSGVESQLFEKGKSLLSEITTSDEKSPEPHVEEVKSPSPNQMKDDIKSTLESAKSDLSKSPSPELTISGKVSPAEKVNEVKSVRDQTKIEADKSMSPDQKRDDKATLEPEKIEILKSPSPEPASTGKTSPTDKFGEKKTITEPETSVKDKPLSPDLKEEIKTTLEPEKTEVSKSPSPEPTFSGKISPVEKVCDVTSVLEPVKSEISKSPSPEPTSAGKATPIDKLEEIKSEKSVTSSPDLKEEIKTVLEPEKSELSKSPSPEPSMAGKISPAEKFDDLKCEIGQSKLEAEKSLASSPDLKEEIKTTLEPEKFELSKSPSPGGKISPTDDIKSAKEESKLEAVKPVLPDQKSDIKNVSEPDKSEKSITPSPEPTITGKTSPTEKSKPTAKQENLVKDKPSSPDQKEEIKTSLEPEKIDLPKSPSPEPTIAGKTSPVEKIDEVKSVVEQPNVQTGKSLSSEQKSDDKDILEKSEKSKSPSPEPTISGKISPAEKQEDVKSVEESVVSIQEKPLSTDQNKEIKSIFEPEQSVISKSPSPEPTLTGKQSPAEKLDEIKSNADQTILEAAKSLSPEKKMDVKHDLQPEKPEVSKSPSPEPMTVGKISPAEKIEDCKASLGSEKIDQSKTPSPVSMLSGKISPAGKLEDIKSAEELEMDKSLSPNQKEEQKSALETDKSEKSKSPTPEPILAGKASPIEKQDVKTPLVPETGELSKSPSPEPTITGKISPAEKLDEIKSAVEPQKQEADKAISPEPKLDVKTTVEPKKTEISKSPSPELKTVDKTLSDEKLTEIKPTQEPVKTEKSQSPDQKVDGKSALEQLSSSDLKMGEDKSLGEPELLVKEKSLLSEDYVIEKVQAVIESEKSQLSKSPTPEPVIDILTSTIHKHEEVKATAQAELDKFIPTDLKADTKSNLDQEKTDISKTPSPISDSAITGKPLTEEETVDSKLVLDSEKPDICKSHSPDSTLSGKASPEQKLTMTSKTSETEKSEAIIEGKTTADQKVNEIKSSLESQISELPKTITIESTISDKTSPSGKSDDMSSVMSSGSQEKDKSSDQKDIKPETPDKIPVAIKCSFDFTEPGKCESLTSEETVSVLDSIWAGSKVTEKTTTEHRVDEVIESKEGVKSILEQIWDTPRVDQSCFDKNDDKKSAINSSYVEETIEHSSHDKEVTNTEKKTTSTQNEFDLFKSSIIHGEPILKKKTLIEKSSMSVDKEEDFEEKIVSKETRSKSVSAIMVGSIYGDHGAFNKLSALDENTDYSKDDSDLFTRQVSETSTSSKSSKISEKNELSETKIHKKEEWIETDRISISPENEVCGFISPDLSGSKRSSTSSLDKSVIRDEILSDTKKESLTSQMTTEKKEMVKTEVKEISSDASSSKLLSLSTKEHMKTSTEDLNLSGKSTPDIAEVETKILTKAKADLSGKITPPTVPVSPSIKSDFPVTQEPIVKSDFPVYIQEGPGFSGISTPKDLSGMSSPGLASVQTNSDSASKSVTTSFEQHSGVETSDSSPKPTSPFPKGLGAIKSEELKTSSGMSTPDMTRMSTPDIMETKTTETTKDSDLGTSTTTTTTTTKTMGDGETSTKTVIESKTIKTESSSSSAEDRPTSKSEVSSSESQSQQTIKETLPAMTSHHLLSKDIMNLKSSEIRSYTPVSDDYEIHEISSPRSDISSGQQSRVVTGWTAGSSEERHYSDDEMPESPLSTTSQAAHSPTSKFVYEADFDLKRSGSGVSKKSDYEIDDSQDDIPPQYGSEEIQSARSISSTYKPDPMSTSFYGALPEMSGKSEPIPISSIKTSEASVPGSDHFQTSYMKSTSHKFLDEADLDFEKALEEHIQVRGTEVMTSIQSKYEYPPKSQPDVNQSFPLDEINKAKAAALEMKDTADSSVPSSSTSQSISNTTTTTTTTAETTKDPIASWGKPLGLPSPAPAPTENEMKTTPKRERKLIISKTKMNNEKNLRKRSESPAKGKKPAPIYIDLTYVPHHGNSYYSHVEFFKRVRARYYVFSGTEPSREVYNALLEAKQTWEDKELEVTIIPTYDTDVLGYWVSENEDLLAKYHIDLSPSASRCTINLQDHETSCSAYRLEF